MGVDVPRDNQGLVPVLRYQRRDSRSACGALQRGGHRRDLGSGALTCATGSHQSSIDRYTEPVKRSKVPSARARGLRAMLEAGILGAC